VGTRGRGDGPALLRDRGARRQPGSRIPGPRRTRREARMNAQVRAEFLKLRTTRTAAALVGLAVAVTALIATLESATAGTRRGMAIPSLATTAGLRDALASTGFAPITPRLVGPVLATREVPH